MRTVAVVLGLGAIFLTIIGWWGLFTPVGRARFDGANSAVPETAQFTAIVAGALAIVIVGICSVREKKESDDRPWLKGKAEQ